MIENLIFPLDYVAITISIIIVIICFLKGIINSLLGLLTWVGSIIITIYSYNDLSNLINSQLLKIQILENYEQITSILSIIISIPLIFLFTIYVLRKIKKFISSDLDKKILGLLVDKIFGFLFGFIFSYIIFSTLLYLTNNFEILELLNSWILKNSYILVTLDNFNNEILNSIIGEKKIIN